MSRKKITWIIILLVIIIGAIYGYREYSRTNKDLQDVKPDFSLAATQLIREFESSDSAAAKKYNGRIVEVNGNVKVVEKDENGYYTIVLGDSAGLSSVRCSLDTTHHEDATRLSGGQSAIIRGACTGFNASDLGLGSDVILNRCVVINNTP